MSTILIIDDNTFCRDLVARILGQAGHVAITAASAAEGFTALASHPVDLILLDNEMPQTPGLVFLRQLRTKMQWASLPVIMLTGNADRQNILTAGQWGACEYILKTSFTPQSLLQRVEKRLEIKHSDLPPRAPATAAAPPPSGTPAPGFAGPPPKICPPAQSVKPVITTTRDKVLQAIDAVAANKTLGGVITQIISIASSPYRGLGDLVSVVRQDPLIAARVFHAANTAAFTSAKGRVSSLEESIRNIGVGTVRTLAMSVGVFEVFPVGKADGTDLLRCWQHALAVACLMDKLVQSSPEISPGIAYLVGLCHDLDELLLRQHFPEVYASALALAHARKVPVAQIYYEVFGISHKELVGHLLAVLNLPEAVAKPIKLFATSENQTLEAQPNPMLRALQMANYYAHALQLTSSAEGIIAPIPNKALAQLSPETLDWATIRCEVLTSTCALARLSPKEQTQFLKPLFPQESTRIWYTRQGSLSAQDPVFAALQLIAQVTEYPHLPNRPEDLADIQAVVVTAPLPDTEKYSSAELQYLVSFNQPCKFILLEPHRTNGSIPTSKVVTFCPYPLSVLALREAIQIEPSAIPTPCYATAK